jgi:hypothetical protein
MVSSWRKVTPILILSLVVPVLCVTLPLRRVDKQTHADGTNVPYTVQVRLFESVIANMIIDLTTPLTFVFCCRSLFIHEKPYMNNSYCVQQDRCSAFICPEGKQCSDQIHTFPFYSVKNKRSEVEVYRQKPDLTIGLFGFNVPDAPIFNYTRKKPLHEYDRQIETTYGNELSFMWEYTDGTLGLSYSPFNASFYRYMREFFPDDQCQFALDIYDAEQRQQSSQTTDMYSSFGGNMILGTNSIVEYLQKSSFANNPISWSEPLRRYNSRIWNILNIPLNDVELLANPSLLDLKYTYNYGHRFNMYDLAVECNDSVYNLFYNYTGVWQAEIDTKITGIALPTNFYLMLESWKLGPQGNGTYTPVIKFGLEQSGRTIRLPMSWLDVQIYDQEENIKIAQGIGIVSPDPVIRIGTKFLERYFVVLDMKNYRVGFINKVNITEVGKCGQKVTCRGAQRYYEPRNICLDPQCDFYLFQYVDDETKECAMGVAFYIVFTLLLLTCCLSEFVMYEIYRRLTTALTQQAAAANL